MIFHCLSGGIYVKFTCASGGFGDPIYSSGTSCPPAPVPLTLSWAEAFAGGKKMRFKAGEGGIPGGKWITVTCTNIFRATANQMPNAFAFLPNPTLLVEWRIQSDTDSLPSRYPDTDPDTDPLPAYGITPSGTMHFLGVEITTVVTDRTPFFLGFGFTPVTAVPSQGTVTITASRPIWEEGGNFPTTCTATKDDDGSVVSLTSTLASSPTTLVVTSGSDGFPVDDSLSGANIHLSATTVRCESNIRANGAPGAVLFSIVSSTDETPVLNVVGYVIEQSFSSVFWHWAVRDYVQSTSTPAAATYSFTPQTSIVAHFGAITITASSPSWVVTDSQAAWGAVTPNDPNNPATAEAETLQIPTTLVFTFKPTSAVPTTGEVTITASADIWAAVGELEADACTAAAGAPPMAVALATVRVESLNTLVLEAGAAGFVAGQWHALTCAGSIFEANGEPGMVRFDIVTTTDTTPLLAQVGMRITPLSGVPTKVEWGHARSDNFVSGVGAAEIEWWFTPFEEVTETDFVTIAASANIFMDTGTIYPVLGHGENELVQAREHGPEGPPIEMSGGALCPSHGSCVLGCVEVAADMLPMCNQLRIQPAPGARFPANTPIYVRFVPNQMISANPTCPESPYCSGSPSFEITFSIESTTDTDVQTGLPGWPITPVGTMHWREMTVDDTRSGRVPRLFRFLFTPTTALPAGTGVVTITASQPLWSTDEAATGTVQCNAKQNGNSPVAFTCTTDGPSELLLTVGDGGAAALEALVVEVRPTFDQARPNGAAGTEVEFTIASAQDTVPLSGLTGFTFRAAAATDCGCTAIGPAGGEIPIATEATTSTKLVLQAKKLPFPREQMVRVTCVDNLLVNGPPGDITFTVVSSSDVVPAVNQQGYTIVPMGTLTWGGATSNMLEDGQTASKLQFTFVPANHVPASSGRVTIACNRPIWLAAGPTTCIVTMPAVGDDVAVPISDSQAASTSQLVVTAGQDGFPRGVPYTVACTDNIATNAGEGAVTFSLWSSIDQNVAADQIGYTITTARTAITWEGAASNNQVQGEIPTSISFTFTPTVALPPITGSVTITASDDIWSVAGATACSAASPTFGNLVGVCGQLCGLSPRRQQGTCSPERACTPASPRTHAHCTYHHPCSAAPINCVKAAQHCWLCKSRTCIAGPHERNGVKRSCYCCGERRKCHGSRQRGHHNLHK